ncbi:sigma-54-dependent transcriptional regulator [Paraliomyxa miuraensis]|uniref:sigma-54-dependent transcriptional regulator n=1 Tax=Paraliomyxa miuraensis TaxID=376150 RepID=UPI00225516CD|nr:sigma-54 dependent transcriptional regulator [Paraliomyxa miuraensis]MCX4243330.1 sigma-54 dependent transcriptional regulator [Paraliomyxa miuraensis]
MSGKLLIVDDDQPTCEFLAAKLATEGHGVTWETTPADAIEHLQHDDFDALLTDLAMPGTSGLDLCARALQIEPELPVIVVTGRADLEAAVSAMRVGAYDFITKPVDTKLLTHTIERAVEHRKLSREVRRLRQELARTQGTGKLVGRSRAIRAVYDLISRVAVTEAPVLILGESGTGKELVARAIHEASSRASGPFIALNCAAVPPSLIESELFGHVRGAFTDARRARDGLFAQANGGTLFLDEVADLPLELQPKLLRALQEQEVRPVGGSEEVAFDARIITATNADLEARVEAERFRGDLMYRIDVVRIELPPLRDRGRDVLLLAQHFLEKYGAERGAPRILDEDAAAKLLAYDWPGNVRELENCIQRALALARHERIVVDDLPAKVREYRSDRVMLTFEDTDELVTLDELEARYIRKVLEMVGGNKSKAARLLGVDRRSLYRRLEKFGCT